MGIYITGDIHGDVFERFSAKNWADSKTLTEDDIVIILGDFGVLWENNSNGEEKYKLKWLESKPWRTLFVAGNHENYNRLNKLPIEDKYGGKVHKISSKVYHLINGIFTIEGKTFLVFGGARSTDKYRRVENISWWKEEEVTRDEFERVLDEFVTCNKKIDYLLSHTCRAKYLPNLLGMFYKENDVEKTSQYLEYFYSAGYPGKNLFGHFHVNRDFKDGGMCLYEKIIKI